MRITAAGIVAHQGGWDEILFVLGPIVVVVVLLRVLKRRVDRHHQLSDETDDTSAGDVTGR